MRIRKILTGLFLLTSSVLAANSSVDMLLNNYFRDQAGKQIDLLLPRGKYTLQVSVISDQEKINAENSFSMNALRLPMSSTVITANEMHAITSNGLNDETAGKLLSYIKKVDIKVSVVPTVTQPVREMIQSSIMNTLALDASRGDVVKVDELPEGFATAWASASEFASSASAYLKPALVISGVIGLMLLLASGILYASFVQFSGKITSEARSMGNTIKEAIETGAQNAPAASMNAFDKGRDRDRGGESRFSGNENSNFAWDKVETDTIVSFALDCMDHPKYTSVPVVLVNSVLPPEKSAELEKNIPEISMQSMLTVENPVKAAEITSVFQNNLSEYRRSTRSPMGKQVIHIPLAKLSELALNLEKMELALLINAFTPLRRNVFLKALTTEMKLELAKVTTENISNVEHKKFELSLLEKLEAIPVERKNEADSSQSMSYLSNMILKAESFEEDESLFKSGKESGTGFKSVLQAIDIFDLQDWEQSNIQDIAMAFCGYSETVRSEVTSKYSGKKQEWFKNFLKKFEGSVPEFASPGVVAVQESIKNRIKEKLEQRNNESQKEAA